MKQPAFLLMIGIFALPAWAGKSESVIQKVPATAQSRSNPFEGNQRATAAGAKLFGRECSACHGKTGEGSSKAPGLRSGELAGAPAGTLFWILRNGSLRRGMPSFAHLPEPERWQIVTYLNSLQSRPVSEADAAGSSK